MQIIFRILFLSAALYTFPLAGNAQKPAGKSGIKPVQKFRQPKLFTTLGSFRDSSFITVNEAESIIAMPLKITDDKNNTYTVSSYQFLYKKRVVTEDEKTGKVSPATSISSDRFKTTPLPALWVSTIQEQVKAGEEFYFFDVIAKDAQGRVMLSSGLKLTVK